MEYLYREIAKNFDNGLRRWGKKYRKAQECNPNSIKKLFIDPSEKIEIEDLKALANSIKIPINSIDKFCLLSRDLLKAF